MAAPAIWLDCDPGHDDFVALLLLCSLHRAGKVRFLGVSTTYGNSGLDQTTLNARRALWLCGLERIVPVVRGVASPLCREAQSCPEIHGPCGLGGYPFSDAKLGGYFNLSLGMGDDYVGEEVEEESWTEEQREMWRTLSSSESCIEGVGKCLDRFHAISGDKPWLVVTGCMTLAAQVLGAYPEVPLAGVSWMGGAIGAGNVSPAAEFNALLDPEAVASVLSRGGKGLRVLMMPLEVTHTVLATDEVLERIKSHADTAPKFTNMLVEILLFFQTSYREVFRLPFPPVHDPMAVLHITHPDLVTEATHCNVECDTSRGADEGNTIVDLLHLTKRPINCHVATKCDVSKTWDTIFEAITSLAPVAEAIVSKE